MKNNTKLILAALLAAAAGLPACSDSNALTTGDIPSTPAPAPAPVTPLPSTLYKGPAGLEPYVLKFIDDAKAQGVDVVPELTSPQLEIQIAKLDSYGSSVIGLCETGTNLRRVTFDPDFWNVVSETQRELLAHHELGHCMLYRGHRTTVLTSGVPASIMYPSIFSNSTYLNNYDYYQQELFGQAASSDSTDRFTPTVHVCEPGDELPSEPSTPPLAEGV